MMAFAARLALTLAVSLGSCLALFRLRKRSLNRLLEPRWFLWSRTALERSGVPAPFVPFLAERLESHYRAQASDLAHDVANVGPTLSVTFTALLISLPLVSRIVAERSSWAWSTYLLGLTLSVLCCAFLWFLALYGDKDPVIPLKRMRARLVPEYRCAWTWRPLNRLSLSNSLGCVPGVVWVWLVLQAHALGG